MTIARDTPEEVVMERFNQTRRKILASGAVLVGSGLYPALVLSAQEEPFRVAALNPITGSGGPYGSGMQKMIMLVADEINAAHGRQVRIYPADTQTRPQAAALAAQKLLDIDKVQAILGTWSSGVTLAVLAQTNDAGAILMDCSGSDTISQHNPKGLEWRFQATSSRFGQGFYKVAKQRGFKRIATMGPNNASTLSIMAGFDKAYAADGGKVVKSVVYEPNLPSYQSELQEVLNAKPDCIVTGCYLYDASILLREWYQIGQKVTWMMPGFVDIPNLVKSLGAQVCDGIVVVDIMNNVGSKSLERFDALYKKHVGGAPTTYAAMCYDMMMVTGLAMVAAGKNAGTAQINGKVRDVSSDGGVLVTTFEEGRKALDQGKKVSYQGASSRLNFDSQGNTTQDLSVGVVKNGVVVNVGKA